MKAIPVKEFVPPMGREWDVNSYPGTGAFSTPQGIVFICAGQMMSIGLPFLSLIEALADGGGAGGISESTLLKAIAISAQPNLAPELLRGGHV